MYISYRSYLKSCNYCCSYCPFGKFKETEKQVEKDKKALDKFYQFIKNQTSTISLFFTPYGEILGKEYYWEYFAAFSRLPIVETIGCQTNNSFPVEKMLGIFHRNQGERSKLRLWCTYHPDMVLEDIFLKQCRKLGKEQIAYSVGVVAQNGKIGNIVSIREKLPFSTYIWCNAIEGSSQKYTESEQEQLRAIDSYFENECIHLKSDSTKCISGKTAVFIEANGDYYGCHISKVRMGNIYENSEGIEFIKVLSKQAVQCMARECSCYLAYRLRTDLREKLPYDFFNRINNTET